MSAATPRPRTADPSARSCPCQPRPREGSRGNRPTGARPSSRKPALAASPSPAGGLVPSLGAVLSIRHVFASQGRFFLPSGPSATLAVRSATSPSPGHFSTAVEKTVEKNGLSPTGRSPDRGKSGSCHVSEVQNNWNSPVFEGFRPVVRALHLGISKRKWPPDRA